MASQNTAKPFKYMHIILAKRDGTFFFSTNFTHIVFPFEIPVLGLTCSDLYLLQNFTITDPSKARSKKFRVT